MAETPALETAEAVIDPVQTPDNSGAGTEGKTLLGGKEVKAEVKTDAKEGEAKPEGEAEAKQEGETKTEEKVVPEKYELTVPEGMTLDNVLLEKVTPIFKELGITKEGAQKLVDAYAPYVKSQVETQQQEAIKNWKAQVDGWKDETVKELGAEAPKQLAFAAKFIDRFAGDDAKAVREFLDETGVGNRNIVVKMFINAGKMISEDSFVDPNKSTSGSDDLSILYPSMK